MKKATYIKCPRCELNYIKSTDKYCHVCLTELKLAGEAPSTDEDLELCPVCGQNFISSEQAMCEDCLKQKGIDLEYDENDSEDEERSESRNVWDDTDSMSADDDVELIPLSAMEEDELDDDDELESEEEESDRASFDDDFEPAYLDDDDFDDYDDEDDEDDDDYDDDEDED